MRAILPRQRSCVLCGDAIEGKGRIDRLYCSASCRNLAWRFRAGKRAGKATAAAPVQAARRRGGLLRQSWGLQGEVAATRRRISDLQAQRAQAEAQLSTERQRWAQTGAAQTQERTAWNAERTSLQAELAAAQQQSARDQATLQAVNRAYSTLLQDQTVWASERTRMRAELAHAREQADAQEAKLQEEVQRLARRNQELNQLLVEAERTQTQAQDRRSEAERIPEAPADRLAEQQRPLSQSKPHDQPRQNVAHTANDATPSTCPPSGQTSRPASTAAPPPSDHPPSTTNKDTPPPKPEPPSAVSRLKRILKKLVEPDPRRKGHLLD